MAKAQQRERNRLRWEDNEKNVNHILAEARQTAATILAEAPETADNKSLSKLRTIMADVNSPLYQRLEAAEIILSYELAPGSLVNSPTEQVASASYRFLVAVVDDAETPSQIRFKALRSLAAIENARARAGDTETAQARRNSYIDEINRARRAELVRRNLWPQVCAQAIPWSLSLSDDIDQPPATRSHDSIGASLDRCRNLPAAELASRLAARTAHLLSVRARNRPDDWLPPT